MNNLWNQILNEASANEDRILQVLVKDHVSNCEGLPEAVNNVLTSKLSDTEVDQNTLASLITEVIHNIQASDDLVTFFDRDFACKTYLEVLLLNTGFQAVMAFRIAHELWKREQYFDAKWLNMRISQVYGVDIHPAAKIGKGFVIDHCTGVVIGETCEIEENVYVFHNVTLGGTGRHGGDRHPKVQSNVVIGTGATILGAITLGENSVVAAGSVVLEDVPPNTLVAGIPAVKKGEAKKVQ